MERIHQGKVRDVYRLNEQRLLIVASDRLSAYDVVFPDPIPGKGIVLTALTRWWLSRIQEIVPSHWSPDQDETLAALSVPAWPDLAERGMVVERCRVIPYECVVRGYAFGSYLKDHPEIAPMTRFETPLFTPSTKATEGHDEPVSFETMRADVGSIVGTLESLSLTLFDFASAVCRRAGIVLVDTKFEFGYGQDGQIKLVDECFTPDSSRFILAADVEQGNYDSFDKQIVRDYVDQIGWDRRPPAPRLPPEIISKTLERYRSIQQRIMETL